MSLEWEQKLRESPTTQLQPLILEILGEETDLQPKIGIPSSRLCALVEEKTGISSSTIATWGKNPLTSTVYTKASLRNWLSCSISAMKKKGLTNNGEGIYSLTVEGVEEAKKVLGEEEQSAPLPTEEDPELKGICVTYESEDGKSFSSLDSALENQKKLLTQIKKVEELLQSVSGRDDGMIGLYSLSVALRKMDMGFENA